VCAGKPVIGLPGNPVSALVVAWLFLAPVIEQISGLKFSVPRPSVASRLAINIPSQAGREDWAPVKLTWNVEQEEWMAEPVFGKSNLIYTLVRADGLVRVPIAANGLSAGEPVNVFLFQA
jgi:molybdopterin molybdotransferase